MPNAVWKGAPDDWTSLQEIADTHCRETQGCVDGKTCKLHQMLETDQHFLDWMLFLVSGVGARQLERQEACADDTVE